MVRKLPPATAVANPKRCDSKEDWEFIEWCSTSLHTLPNVYFGTYAISLLPHFPSFSGAFAFLVRCHSSPHGVAITSPGQISRTLSTRYGKHDAFILISFTNIPVSSRSYSSPLCSSFLLAPMLVPKPAPRENPDGMCLVHYGCKLSSDRGLEYKMEQGKEGMRENSKGQVGD